MRVLQSHLSPAALCGIWLLLVLPSEGFSHSLQTHSLHNAINRGIFSKVIRRASSMDELLDTVEATDDGTANSNEETPRTNNQIRVSSSIDLPFSRDIAYDAFSKHSRQPEWADWLSSVEYLDEDKDRGETLWKMRFLKLGYSWKAISTLLDRPHVMEWKSTSGLRNFGRVEYTELSPTSSHMKLTMTLLAPRVMVKLMGSDNGAMSRFVEKRMLQPTLQNFRDIIAKEVKDSSP